MCKSTILAEGQITDHGDRLTIEYVKPNELPAMVRVVWPRKGTLVRPDEFSHVAAEAGRLLALASVRLKQIQVHGR